MRFEVLYGFLDVLEKYRYEKDCQKQKHNFLTPSETKWFFEYLQLFWDTTINQFDYKVTHAPSTPPPTAHYMIPFLALKYTRGRLSVLPKDTTIWWGFTINFVIRISTSHCNSIYTLVCLITNAHYRDRFAVRYL